MTFFRSPTLLVRPREYGIFAAVAHRIGNRSGFELLVTLILNSIMTFSIQPMAGPALQYKGRKKRVPQNIHELLTARAIAYWDDGTCKSYKSKNRTYRFSTHSFEDQKRLVQALINNFSGLMAATIQKQRSHYILYIRSKSTERFVNLISPYLPFTIKFKTASHSTQRDPEPKVRERLQGDGVLIALCYHGIVIGSAVQPLALAVGILGWHKQGRIWSISGCAATGARAHRSPT